MLGMIVNPIFHTSTIVIDVFACYTRLSSDLLKPHLVFLLASNDTIPPGNKDKVGAAI